MVIVRKVASRSIRFSSPPPSLVFAHSRSCSPACTTSPSCRHLESSFSILCPTFAGPVMQNRSHLSSAVMVIAIFYADLPVQVMQHCSNPSSIKFATMYAVFLKISPPPPFRPRRIPPHGLISSASASTNHSSSFPTSWSKRTAKAGIPST